MRVRWPRSIEFSRPSMGYLMTTTPRILFDAPRRGRYCGALRGRLCKSWVGHLSYHLMVGAHMFAAANKPQQRTRPKRRAAARQ